jgi:CheY-like chemotaxis protein
MNANLRILLLEDSLADAKLIERELSRDGFNFFLSRIRTESELRHELAAAPPDLVLSNHRLTELDGFRALAIVHQLCPRLPFIFVSGSNDQQMVYDMYEEGANDYVFKRDLRDLRLAVAKASGVEPDSGRAPSAGEERQEELVPQLFMPACGYLSLCPHCHQSRDEAGQVVPIEDYCHHRIESLVIRKLCEECSLVVLGAGEPPKKAARNSKQVVS